MADLIVYSTPFFVGVVAVILGLGLWNMARGGSANRSQTLMRLRVLAQAVAVAVMVAALYLLGRN